jgi:hypothetical protein
LISALIFGAKEQQIWSFASTFCPALPKFAVGKICNLRVARFTSG